MKPFNPHHIKAVFLVKSPLQLINAAEAREFFGLAGKESLLLLMADRKSRGQLLSLVQNDTIWNHVFSLDELPLFPDPAWDGDHLIIPGGLRLFRNDLYAIVKLRRLASIFPGIEKIFIGDIGNPFMRHFANIVPSAERIALDDGNATYKYAEERCGNLSFVRDVPFGKKLKLFAKRRLLGLKDHDLTAVTFFTTYNIRVAGDDKVVRHAFPFLRKRTDQIGSSDEVYFLGGPLVEAGILTEDELFTQLSFANRKLEGKAVRYVAHRRERPERVKAIGQRFGWETTLFEYPIEFQLARVGPRPAMLASFFSSAVENCVKLFGTTLPIVSFRLDPKNFKIRDTPRGRGIYNLYDQYESMRGEHFEVIQLGCDST